MADSNTEHHAQEAEDLAAILASQNPGTEQAQAIEEVETHSRKGPTRDEIELEINRLSRGPFKKILADVMECAPTAKAMKRLAENKPEKYFSALAQIAQMAGYTKDSTVDVNVNLNVSNMNDAAIAARLAELKQLELQQQTLIQPATTTRPKIAEGASFDSNIIDVPSRLKE